MKLDILLYAALFAQANAAGYVKADANNVKLYKRASTPSVNVLEFENFGYTGYYSQVGELNDVDSDSCSCTLSSTYVAFSGSNAPLNEPVSVHFRGPLVLSKFAVYTSEDFVHGDDSTGNWTRTSYFDASSATSDNVTFLTKAGTNSSCLGKALTYAGSDGISEASASTILDEDVLLTSNEEYAIFSNVSCGSSGVDNDCGVYRSGIPAYQGFSGTIKTFLFQFTMPNETTAASTTSNYNMPAIWLLNARIPRTSQYSDSVNCSCWRSGCGEFDIFEVTNTTGSLAGELRTTIHDYQGTGEIETGLLIDGYIPRNYETTYSGGVSFDKDGNAIVFVSNSTTFGSTISAASLNAWISGAGTAATDTLSSASAAVPSATATTKKSDGSTVGTKSLFGVFVAGVVGAVMMVF